MPLVIAGDVFDRWDVSPHLINFALENLPETTIYAVPGQHDLPYHNYGQIKKSAYWTLCHAGRVVNLPPNEATVWVQPDAGGRLYMVGFPWNHALRGRPTHASVPRGAVKLAVVHAYCWTKGHSHPGAERFKHVDEHRRNLSGFNTAVFGDNHVGFRKGYDDGDDFPQVVVNCGTLVRRTTAEIGLHPRAWVLYTDGRVRPQDLLSPAKDRFTADPLAELEANGVSPDLIRMLEELPDDLTARAVKVSDFRGELIRALNSRKVPDGVRREVLDAVGEGDE